MTRTIPKLRDHEYMESELLAHGFSKCANLSGGTWITPDGEPIMCFEAAADFCRHWPGLIDRALDVILDGYAFEVTTRQDGYEFTAVLRPCAVIMNDEIVRPSGGAELSPRFPRLSALEQLARVRVREIQPRPGL